MLAGTLKPCVGSAQDTHCIICSLKNTVQNWNNENLASGFPVTDFYYLVKCGLSDLCQFMLVQIPSFWTCALQWFCSVVPKLHSWGDHHQRQCWPVVGPSMQNQKLLVRPGTHSVSSNPLIKSHSSKKDPQFCVFIHHFSDLPNHSLPHSVQSLTDLWSDTSSSEGDSNCSHILLPKSFPASPTLLPSAWALPDVPEGSPGSWAMWDCALLAESTPATAAS